DLTTIENDGRDLSLVAPDRQPLLIRQCDHDVRATRMHPEHLAHFLGRGAIDVVISHPNARRLFAVAQPEATTHVRSGPAATPHGPPIVRTDPRRHRSHHQNLPHLHGPFLRNRDLNMAAAVTSCPLRKNGGSLGVPDHRKVSVAGLPRRRAHRTECVHLDCHDTPRTGAPTARSAWRRPLGTDPSVGPRRPGLPHPPPRSSLARPTFAPPRAGPRPPATLRHAGPGDPARPQR